MKTAIFLTLVDQDGVICIIRHEMITETIVNILNDAGIQVQEDEIGGDSVLRFTDEKTKMLFRLKHG